MAEKINVDYKHPDYESWIDQWIMLRDSIKGNKQIKEKGSIYLPRPGAQILFDTDSNEDRTIKNNAFKNYLSRAHYPGLVSLSQNGMLGIIGRKPHKIELPPQLEYLQESATPDGIPIDSLVSRILSEVLLMGRLPLAVDFVPEEGRPLLTTYQAESLINWRMAPIAGRQMMTLAVLELMEEKTSASDEYEPVIDQEWISASLNADGVGYKRFVRDKETDKIMFLDEQRPALRSGPLREIPIVVIGATDLLPDVEPPPLLGIADLALAIYRNSADYEQSLYMTAQPTPVVSGVSPSDPMRPRSIGSSTIWFFDDPQAKATLLEFTGAGTGAQRTAIQDKANAAIQQGVGLIDPQRNQAESGEALRYRQSARTSVLHELVATVEAGLTKALRWAAVWADANPEDVVVDLNRDFYDVQLSSQDLRELVATWQSGAISWDTLFDNLKSGEIVSPETTKEDELAQIESGSSMLGSDIE